MTGQAQTRKPIRVQIAQLRVAFGAFRAVDDIDLVVEPGEIVALLGPSGCGKSTILKSIAGLISPSAGSIRFDDQAIEGTPAHLRNVGMVFQNYALFPHLSVRENIAIGLRLQRWSSSARKTRIGEMLRLLRIEELADKYPSQISGGQQQRAALARTLAVRPAVLLLDEPLSALDRQLRDAMRLELPVLLRSVGITTILVTHDQDEALTIADRVIVMRGGRIEQVGTPRDVYDFPANRFVANFIGQTNYLPGIVRSVSGKAATVELDGSGAIVSAIVADSTMVGAQVEIGVRPEFLKIHHAVPRPDPEQNTLQGLLVREIFFGNGTDYQVQLGGGSSIMVRCPRLGTLSATEAANSAIRVTWSIHHASLFNRTKMP
jgi:putative spermidine/putrescine transport system ATP-binding protein